MASYVIGIDYGTLSGRSVLVDTADGTVIATSAFDYPHGVLDRTLPDGTPLPADYALQHPQDYLDVVYRTIPRVLETSGVSRDDVVGIGLDATACTALPLDQQGQPLCFRFPSEPQSYIKMWKHHGAQALANRLTRAAESVCPELLTSMGGSISAESTVGVGTTFTLRLTQEVSLHTVPAQKRKDAHFIAPDCLILVVDDNAENLELLKTLLGRTMIQIDTATNGIDGIQLAESKQYDVIILDYMMPAPDGIETLSRMKQKGIKSSFIALTADAIAGTGAKLTAAGFDEYVTKPVDWLKFEQILLRYIPKEKVAFENLRQPSVTPGQLAELTASIKNCELDISFGLKRVDNSLDMYRRILLLFCGHYENNHTRAEELFAEGNLSGLCLVIHSLKAQARGIGGNLLFHMAETLEQKLRQDDTAFAAAAFPLLLMQWERTQRHAALLAELLPSDEEKAASESVEALTEKAVYALKNSLWLNAKEAVEALQRVDNKNAYDEILQLIERFAFKEALYKLQNRTEIL